MNHVSFSLKDLLDGVEVLQCRGDIDTTVRAITRNSHHCRKGDLFVAIKGSKADGHDFARQACLNGAVACVVERFVGGLPADVTQVKVKDARKALALMAANLHGHPSHKMCLIGITGTNGKTTTAYLLESILRAAGHRVGVIGTVEYRYGEKVLPASHTTPDGLELHGLLRRMLEEGATHVIMEVTSHGLEQKRVAGCRFRGGIFTNLSRDHLDYHLTMECYLDAKTSFFRDYLLDSAQGGWAVLNSKDPASATIAKSTQARPIWFGSSEGDHFRVLDARVSTHGITLKMDTPLGKMHLSSPLVGGHNVENILAACSAAWALGVDDRFWIDGICGLRKVPGRFEPVESQNGVVVIVDYAHTPDALEKALKNVRSLGAGRVICVFGCGGDRDRGKRPIMGAVVAANSDLAIVTSDNPRTEEPKEIIAQILKGFEGSSWRRLEEGLPEDTPTSGAYAVIEDRGEAIRAALRLARPGDVVLIAGKGHEPFQIIGHTRIPFDDREVASRALEELGCSSQRTRRR